MAMYKACPYCGRIHPDNYECKAKPKRAYNTDEERKARSTYAWYKKSMEIRNRAQGLCEVCKDKGIYTYRNLEVHHIQKLRDDISGLLDNENLICLCVEHHKQADAGKIKVEYLKSLAIAREK